MLEYAFVVILSRRQICMGKTSLLHLREISQDSVNDDLWPVMSCGSERYMDVAGETQRTLYTSLSMHVLGLPQVHHQKS
jgi:hypothetical protein